MSSIATFPITPSAQATRVPSWVNIASHLDPKYGGISKVLPEFCAAVAEDDNVSLFGFCDARERLAAGDLRGVRVQTVSPGRVSGLFGATARALLEALRVADGAHIHGLWEPHCLAAVRAANAAGKPYILSAHGMLEPWALRNKRWKKEIYSLFVERSNVRGAACLHALTRAEADNYRSYGAKNPIAIVPNGVEVPAAVTPQLFFGSFPGLAQKRCVLFLGRIHYKKGLDLLVKAWKQISAQDRDVHLVIAGPDFENTQESVEQSIAEAGLQDRITLTGMLSGELKWSAIAASEIFVLPSYSEGFSVSVLEAMGMGKPVIVTRQCNVPEVSRFECGWEIDPDDDQLASAIRQYLNLSAARLSELGSNGQALVRRVYSWNTIGAQMREVYRWVLGGGVPNTVEMVSL